MLPCNDDNVSRVFQHGFQLVNRIKLLVGLIKHKFFAHFDFLLFVVRWATTINQVFINLVVLATTGEVTFYSLVLWFVTFSSTFLATYLRHWIKGIVIVGVPLKLVNSLLIVLKLRQMRLIQLQELVGHFLILQLLFLPVFNVLLNTCFLLCFLTCHAGWSQTGISRRSYFELFSLGLEETLNAWSN